MSHRSLESLSPTQSLDIENALSLVPRVKILLTVHRADHSVKPIDEWKLKRSLIEFLKSSFSVDVSDDDVDVRKFKDLKKRKREDSIAHGALFIRHLGFLSKLFSRSKNGDATDEDVKVLEKKFVEWRRSVVVKMDGIELNLEGVKFKLTAAVPVSDDFDELRKEWEDLNAFGNRGYSRGGRQQPDTILLRGVPSRWFAEPRVSSRPSMLVTHTIFSVFGKIRNLNVSEDDDLGKDEDKGSGNIFSGLQCKIVVQFEKYKDFHTALKVLCGRSLQKQGSLLKADYEVTWDKDGFFRNVRSSEAQEKSSRMTFLGTGNYTSEAYRGQSHFSRYSPDNSRTKRFKACKREQGTLLSAGVCNPEDLQTTSF